MRRSAEALRMRVPGLPAIPDPRVLDDPVGRRGSGDDIDEMIARPLPSIGGPGAILAQLRRTSIDRNGRTRSEEHTSELQSLMRISYAVFCLKKKTTEQFTMNKTHTLYTHRNHKNTEN